MEHRLPNLRAKQAFLPVFREDRDSGLQARWAHRQECLRVRFGAHRAPFTVYSPAYFRAVGPMYGMSQRDPENALIIAITMMTRKARWTSA